MIPDHFVQIEIRGIARQKVKGQPTVRRGDVFVHSGFFMCMQGTRSLSINATVENATTAARAECGITAIRRAVCIADLGFHRGTVGGRHPTALAQLSPRAIACP
ncbi:hypothetical protein [Paraburkholderia sp. SIMBA_030]|uniref:hypothetical protein n=1 Tax=Paraburkholderia sp. SIMBA_030 TaxID=3085773 RepID=UPI00397B2400